MHEQQKQIYVIAHFRFFFCINCQWPVSLNSFAIFYFYRAKCNHWKIVWLGITRFAQKRANLVPIWDGLQHNNRATFIYQPLDVFSAALVHLFNEKMKPSTRLDKFYFWIQIDGNELVVARLSAVIIVIRKGPYTERHIKCFYFISWQ